MKSAKQLLWVAYRKQGRFHFVCMWIGLCWCFLEDVCCDVQEGFFLDAFDLCDFTVSGAVRRSRDDHAAWGCQSPRVSGIEGTGLAVWNHFGRHFVGQWMLIDRSIKHPVFPVSSFFVFVFCLEICMNGSTFFACFPDTSRIRNRIYCCGWGETGGSAGGGAITVFGRKGSFHLVLIFWLRTYFCVFHFSMLTVSFLFRPNKWSWLQLSLQRVTRKVGIFDNRYEFC